MFSFGTLGAGQAAKAWDAFAKSKEGREFIKREGATLEGLMEESGASVAGHYAAAKLDATVFEAVREAYEEGSSITRAAEVLEEYAKEQEELDHPAAPEEAEKIAAADSPTGEEITPEAQEDAPAVDEETGDFEAPEGTEKEQGDRGAGLVNGMYAEAGDGSVYGVARVEDLSISADVPQFKKKEVAGQREAANEDGTTHELSGGWNAKSAPIIVWRRRDGRLEVISGRHRLAHAKKNGVGHIAVRVYDEDAAHDAAWAKLYDVEVNILEGMCGAIDVAFYFRHNPMSIAEAEARGLMPKTQAGGQTAASRMGIMIATRASGYVFDSLVNGGVSAEDAYMACVITESAEGQELALKARRGTKGKKRSWEYVTALVRGAEQMAPEGGGSLTDLFGFDEGFAKRAEKMANYVEAVRKQLRRRIDVLSGAGSLQRKGEMTREMGVKIDRPEDAVKIIERLAKLDAAYEAMDPGLGIVEAAEAWDGKSEPDLRLTIDDLRFGDERASRGEGSFSVSPSLRVDIHKAYENEYGEKNDVPLCSCPALFRMLGLAEAPIVTRQHTVRKLRLTHKLTEEQIVEAVQRFDDPLGVIVENADSVIILPGMLGQNATGEQSDMMAAIHLQRARNGAHFMASLYPLDNLQKIEMQLQQGNLRYCKYNAKALANVSSNASGGTMTPALVRLLIHQGFNEDTIIGSGDVKGDVSASVRNLAAVHTIGVFDFLNAAEKLGGMPMPSVAVTRLDKPYKWGDADRAITLVARPDMVDPRRGTEVYSRDAWTGVMPEIGEFGEDGKDYFYDEEREEYVEATLENLTDYLYERKSRAGEAKGWDVEKVARAYLARRLRSMDEVKGERERLQGEDEVRVLSEDIVKWMNMLSERYDTWLGDDEMRGVLEALADVDEVTEGSVREAIMNWTDADGRASLWELQNSEAMEEGSDFIKETVRILNELRAEKTDYLEAVPQRAVKMNEWAYALFSDKVGNKESVRRVCLENGIVPVEYKAGERDRALGDLIDDGDVSFSVIGEHARTWGRYKDRAFAGRDDGRMRAEIDASKAKLKKGGMAKYRAAAYEEKDFCKLGDLLSYPELYAAYPWMREVPVDKQPKGRMGSVAVLTPLDKDKTGRIRLGEKETEEETRRSLLHEVQHLIQRVEHFASGASSGGMVREVMRELGREGELPDTNDEWVWDAEKKEFVYNPFSELYYRAAGEIEARNVAARAGMSARERLERAFNETLDRPASEAIAFDSQEYLYSYRWNALRYWATNEKSGASPDVSMSVRNLAAVHTLSVENFLKQAKEWGGMPLPSVAVTRLDRPYDWDVDHEPMVMLVGRPDMVDPEGGAEVYARDAWMGRMPEVEEERGEDGKVRRFFYDEKGEKVDATLENMTGYLMRRKQKGNSAHETPDAARSLMARRLRSMEDVKGRRRMLQAEPENRVTDVEIYRWMDMATEHDWGWSAKKARTLFRVLADVDEVTKWNVLAAIEGSEEEDLMELQNGLDEDSDFIRETVRVMKEMRKERRNYVEATPRRVVKMDEWVYAVFSEKIPDKDEVRRVCRENGIIPIEYKAGERNKALKDLIDDGEVSFSVRGASLLDRVNLREMAEEEKMSRLMTRARRGAARWRRVFMDDKTSAADAARALGEVSSVMEAVYMYLPAGERPVYAGKMKLVEAYARLVETGRVWHRENAKSEEARAKQEVLDEAMAELERVSTVKGEALREVREGYVREVAGRKLSEVAVSMVEDAVDAVERHLVRREMDVVKRMAEALKPKKLKSGKPAPGKMSAAGYRRFAKYMKMVEMSAAEKAERMEELAGKLDKESEAEGQEPIEEEMRELATFGALGSGRLAEARRGVRELVGFVRAERASWEGRVELEKEQMRHFARVAVEAMGGVDRNKLAERRDRAKKPLRTILGTQKGFMSLGQMWMAMQGVPALREMAEWSLERLARGNVALGMRERALREAEVAFMAKELGLTSEAARNNFLVDLKRERATGVRKAGEKRVHRVRVSVEEAREIVAMNF